jgi:drug/metabolite transporter (DMT)-like permease
MRYPVTAGSISTTGGIACIMMGGFFLTTNDAALKWLTGGYPVGEIMALRGIFAFLPIAVFAWRAGGWRSLRVRHWHAQSARALFFVASSFIWVFGLIYLPLADAMAATFTGPIMITVLAPFLLGEYVGWRRWAAVVMGFCGILLMIKPTMPGLHLAILIPIVSVMGGVARDIITRRIAGSESSVGTLAFTTSAAILFGFITLPFGWVMPSTHDWLILAVSGILMGTAHFLYIEALRLAEAVIVMPFKYFNMVWAVALGFVIFGDLPDAWILSGTLLVVISGLYIMRRESIRRR